MKNIAYLLILLSLVLTNANAAVQDSVKEMSVPEESEAAKEAEKSKVDISLHKISNNEIEAIKKEAQVTKELWRKRIPRSISLATSKRQLRAQKYLSSKNYTEAINVLERVLDRSSTEDYEKAKTLTLIAQAHLNLKQYAKAESSITQALELETLGYHEACDALLFLAQTQLVDRNYKDAKSNLIRYNEISPNKVAPAYFMLATIEYELEEYPSSLQSLEQALKLIKEPSESWLFFAAAIYAKSDLHAKAEKILKDLVGKKPANKNYWMFLVGVLFEQDKTAEALKYFELAEKSGFIKSESEQTTRASLLMGQEIPFKAAKALEAGLADETIEKNRRNYESLASFWFVAKEYDLAIKAYNEASKLSETGEVELYLGQIYLEKEDWAQAEKSFRQALKKGNLKTREGNAYIGLGMTSYFKEDKESALRYFNQASKYKTQKEAASRWLGYLK